ncbi:hypothetical protein PVAP13_9NG327700 [Panicum virgatum]|uniref:Uncharacterized protein n=1 Tax=Panicum virgatum TaxID=38727 RepID=A0A8T0MS83_PANVG|nr:hypothetical protein PVAP13_9NG327700 [Panicum virgatum]
MAFVHSIVKIACGIGIQCNTLLLCTTFQSHHSFLERRLSDREARFLLRFLKLDISGSYQGIPSHTHTQERSACRLAKIRSETTCLAGSDNR